MTKAAQIAWDDTILPFQLDRTDIRGRVVRMDGALNRILAQHDYPPAIEALVCEAVLLTALIGQAIKLRWKLSLQIRGNGPARLVATDYFAPRQPGDAAQIRAYASYDDARLVPEGPPFAQIGEGYFAILIDQGKGSVPYQGITPIAGGSLAACAQTYFAQSEQLPTTFMLHFGQPAGTDWRGGGVMVQKMPSGPVAPQAAADGEAVLMRPVDYLDRDEREDWRRTAILLDSAAPEELLGPELQPTDLLVRLFHAESPRIFDAQPVAFGCTCSEDRVRNSLSIYSARDIGHMTTEDGKVTADCQFCGAHYELDPATVGFEAGADADGG